MTIDDLAVMIERTIGKDISDIKSGVVAPGIGLCNTSNTVLCDAAGDCTGIGDGSCETARLPTTCDGLTVAGVPLSPLYALGTPTTTGTPDLPAISCNLGAMIDGNYLIGLPKDPQVEALQDLDANNYGYTVSVDANNRLTVAAPIAENAETISVKR